MKHILGNHNKILTIIDLFLNKFLYFLLLEIFSDSF